jgi:hypothetical protein
MPFRDELQSLINRHSMENGSDTPDFVLVEYLADCLAAFDKAVKERERWYGREEPAVHQDNSASEPESSPAGRVWWALGDDIEQAEGDKGEGGR